MVCCTAADGGFLGDLWIGAGSLQLGCRDGGAQKQVL